MAPACATFNESTAGCIGMLTVRERIFSGTRGPCASLPKTNAQGKGGESMGVPRMSATRNVREGSFFSAISSQELWRMV